MQRILGLPCISLGDWNLTPTQLQNMDSFQNLNMECIIPPGKSSTKHLTSERVIDYILASPNIRHIISNVKFKTDTLAQHFAIELEIEAKPRTLQVNTLKQPTLLPMQEALEQYGKLNNYEKWQAYKKAKNRAQQILQKT